MKRILALILVLALVVVGCGRGSDCEDDRAGMWHNTDGTMEWNAGYISADYLAWIYYRGVENGVDELKGGVVFTENEDGTVNVECHDCSMIFPECVDYQQGWDDAVSYMGLWKSGSGVVHVESYNKGWDNALAQHECPGCVCLSSEKFTSCPECPKCPEALCNCPKLSCPETSCSNHTTTHIWDDNNWSSTIAVKDCQLNCKSYPDYDVCAYVCGRTVMTEDAWEKIQQGKLPERE